MGVTIAHARFWDCTAIRIHTEVQSSYSAVIVGQCGELTGSRRVGIVRTADLQVKDERLWVRNPWPTNR
jgi:hypothetical protein